MLSGATRIAPGSSCYLPAANVLVTIRKISAKALQQLARNTSRPVLLEKNPRLCNFATGRATKCRLSELQTTSITANHPRLSEVFSPYRIQ